MKKLFAGVALALLVASGIRIAAAADADPVVGTWQLNPSKSQFISGPALKSQTRTYSQSGNRITSVITTVGPDGKEVTGRATYELNGKDFPVTGVPDYNSLSAKQIDRNTANFTLKKDGKPVGTSSRTVSQDGKTLTSKGKLTLANGEKVESVLVFDKQ